MKKWILFIATILTLCSSVARADDPNDSNKKAIEIYSALAARYMLAKIYLNGEGVTQDYKKLQSKETRVRVICLQRFI